MEVNDIVSVEKFVVECNDMLTGKFLDVNKRLEKLLSVMAKSDDIIDLLAETLEDFDEEAELAKAFSVDSKTGTATINIPTDDKKKLAVITTIFNRFTSGKTNAIQFLETYFQSGKQTPVQNFLQGIILPYRDAICKFFSLPTNLTIDDIKKEQKKEEPKVEEDEAAEEEFPHLGEIIAEIEKNCNQILSLLKFEKKRTDMLDDVEFITNSIIKECEKKDLMVINGLVIGLNYCSKKFKNIKHIVADLNGLIYDYYDYLASGIATEDEPQQEEEHGFLE